MPIHHLHKWSVQSSPYDAPEIRNIRLVGYRDNETEHRVVTSPVVAIDGKKITTHKGSVYILEEIDPGYLAWMQENGIAFDPENPIKDKR